MRRILPTILLSATMLASAQAQDDRPTKTSFGTDITTGYYFRGIHQESSELILQPWLEVGGGIDASTSFRVGTWNSLHEGSTSGARGPGGSGAAGGNGLWYESDFYLAIDRKLNDKLTLSTNYTVMSSPNGTFGNTQELGFSLSLDDSTSTATGKFKGFMPHLTVASELSGGRDAGTHRGTYVELGITPKYQLNDKLTITAPVVLGLSFRNYYENAFGNDDTFGYLSAGLRGSMPLDLSDRYPWQLTGGVEILSLGDNSETFNAGDAVEFIVSFGVSVSW